MSGSPVVVGAQALTVGDVVSVADGAPVALAPAALERIAAARRVVDELVAGDVLIYGLNTGLGHMRNERMPVESLREYQTAMVAAHVGAIGDPLPTRVVRAAMFARIAGAATGGAGISPAVAETLVAMLNRGVHPIVPRIGSVGASDLMHMAAIGVVATGIGGQAEFGGEVLPGPEAMRRAGLSPVELQPKDGLSLISANGVSVGMGALVAARGAASVIAADLAAAASMEAIRGNPSIVDPHVALAKPIAGQRQSADAIRAFLEGSDRCVAGGTASVQDPLSFRVAPQVHGAYREVGRAFADAVETELGSSDDNPLVVVAEHRLISNGNFHPMVLALAADALRPAIAHVGQLSSRRMNHLWNAVFQDPDLLRPEGLQDLAESTGGLLVYAAAARYTELRALAGPVTLDVPPLDLGVEDHATNAPIAVARTDASLDALDDLLAIELLCAQEVIRRSADPGRLGSGVGAAFEVMTEVRSGLGPRPPSDVLHAAVRDALYARIVAAALAA